ncbi:MAG: hypothetical protein WCQ53_02275 [bacterium]
MKHVFFCMLSVMFLSSLATAGIIDQSSPSGKVSIYHYGCSLIPSYSIVEISKDGEEKVALQNYVVLGENVTLKEIPLEKINNDWMGMDPYFDAYAAFTYFCKRNKDLLDGYYYSVLDGRYICDDGEAVFKEVNTDGGCS